MYRTTKKAAAQMARMREAKEAKRLAGPAPDYPAELPTLRREIIIRDHDFGAVEHTIRLYRTNRIDCYRVEIDGRLWKERIGWSRILAGLRKSLPRVSSAN